MNKEVVKIPSSIRYLSEFIVDLPDNCILDKGKIGAGGTSVAIRSSEELRLKVAEWTENDPIGVKVLQYLEDNYTSDSFRTFGK